jgi:hypothetical protein
VLEDENVRQVQLNQKFSRKGKFRERPPGGVTYVSLHCTRHLILTILAGSPTSHPIFFDEAS